MEQRIVEEQERIRVELLGLLNGGAADVVSQDRVRQLYAAQQGIAFAIDGARSPYDMIMNGPLEPLEVSVLPTDIPAGSGDCSAPTHQVSS